MVTEDSEITCPLCHQSWLVRASHPTDYAISFDKFIAHTDHSQRCRRELNRLMANTGKYSLVDTLMRKPQVRLKDPAFVTNHDDLGSPT